MTTLTTYKKLLDKAKKDNLNDIEDEMFLMNGYTKLTDEDKKSKLEAQIKKIISRQIEVNDMYKKLGMIRDLLEIDLYDINQILNTSETTKQIIAE